LDDPIPAEEKERRKALVMEVQQEISARKNDQLLNTRQRVLVDRLEGDQYVGRTERDAPEIDNEVFIAADQHVRVGDFVEVDIFDASEYDLYGRLP
jgi:ribosomal protein S12 methylthiotransferase